MLEKEYEETKSWDTSIWKVELAKERLELARKLFQKLNKLLRRTDYLKSAIYQEEDDEE